MTRNDQDSRRGGRKPGSPGTLSRWIQRRMNARTCTRIRRKGGRVMGMELLILHTVGRRSGQPRESPVTWFADGEDARLVVASGGGSRHPDWYLNLMAHPDRAAIELPGGEPVPVVPRRLTGDDRARAWERITAEQPRYAKYQRKSDREYPVVRLTPR
ncbi:deazaflavin-dependent oxidoreductase (nitroreductase family) [Prauserella shujinwangii]|uniref:Deazaflavin-dependent oxidoreductase (Nitroreductase family) n=1 Tax=Prauserella shujinwangii TaxID=1453103 RepID=A0A2T0LSQ6_9PSEU|nr:nitroreductase/quinone reductase family protein [Prauserella shujinwangii]PRX46653.1 deazaflavin-dependent oxidoreductase (nitroreductase family) [Prauserella shujinwangii]